MKVLMHPIEIIAWFSCEGVPRPLRFKILYNNRATVIKVDKVIFKTEEKIAGNKMLIFRCQSVIDGRLRDFELKYEYSTCRWFLYKM